MGINGTSLFNSSPVRSMWKILKLFRRNLANRKHTKHKIKFLSEPQNPSFVKEVIKRSSPSVKKALCNACINADRGEIELPEPKKRLFHKHRKFFRLLTAAKRSLASKRKALVQTVGSILAVILLALLQSVFAAIGSRFIPSG